MKINQLSDVGIENELFELLSLLFPIHRSITGPGIRKTLDIISQHLSLNRCYISSGEKIFDWIVPNEWSIEEAYIENIKGEKIISIENNNLHIMSYSVPVNKIISRQDLESHLVHDKNRPNAIPYTTSYYVEDWAFCLTYNQYLKLTDDFYKVVIKSKLEPGHLEYGEAFIDNKSSDEILISSYICHPSMANDSLSGVVISIFLYKILSNNPELFSKYNYRFIFIPETIGSIAYLWNNKENVTKRTAAGFVLTCLGDNGPINYKMSYNSNDLVNKITKNILKYHTGEFNIINYIPQGSDERQYGSPGFRLPVGVLTRSMFGNFPEYHTSLDDLNFIKSDKLYDSLKLISKIILAFNFNKTFKRVNPYCEPQMSKYDLYPKRGGGGMMNHDEETRNVMMILNLCDGLNSVLDISNNLNIDFFKVNSIIENLVKSNLLYEDI